MVVAKLLAAKYLMAHLVAKLAAHLVAKLSMAHLVGKLLTVADAAVQQFSIRLALFTRTRQQLRCVQLHALVTGLRLVLVSTQLTFKSQLLSSNLTP